jgi:hypothetical protein
LVQVERYAESGNAGANGFAHLVSERQCGQDRNRRGRIVRRRLAWKGDAMIQQIGSIVFSVVTVLACASVVVVVILYAIGSLDEV